MKLKNRPIFLPRITSKAAIVYSSQDHAIKEHYGDVAYRKCRRDHWFLEWKHLLCWGSNCRPLEWKSQRSHHSSMECSLNWQTITEHDFFDLFLTFLTGHSAKWPVQDGVLGHVSPCFLTLSYTLCYGGCNCFFEWLLWSLSWFCIYFFLF